MVISRDTDVVVAQTTWRKVTVTLTIPVTLYFMFLPRDVWCAIFTGKLRHS